MITDGSEQQLKPLTERWHCITTNDLDPGDCSDVLALAGADLLVCSVSSFSTLAAFLSDSPYLWFQPNLYQHPQGVYSQGDYDAQRDKPGNPTGTALQRLATAPAQLLPRGVGVDLDGRDPRRGAPGRGAASPVAALGIGPGTRRRRAGDLISC